MNKDALAIAGIVFVLTLAGAFVASLVRAARQPKPLPPRRHFRITRERPSRHRSEWEALN